MPRRCRWIHAATPLWPTSASTALGALPCSRQVAPTTHSCEALSPYSQHIQTTGSGNTCLWAPGPEYSEQRLLPLLASIAASGRHEGCVTYVGEADVWIGDSSDAHLGCLHEALMFAVPAAGASRSDHSRDRWAMTARCRCWRPWPMASMRWTRTGARSSEITSSSTQVRPCVLADLMLVSGHRKESAQFEVPGRAVHAVRGTAACNSYAGALCDACLHSWWEGYALSQECGSEDICLLWSRGSTGEVTTAILCRR